MATLLEHGEWVNPSERFFDDPTFLVGAGMYGLVADRTDGMQRPIIQSEADLGQIRNIARILCDKYPPAVCALKNLQNFIAGTGSDFNVKPVKGQQPSQGLVDLVQYVIDRFRKDNHFDGDLDRELERRKSRDGEWFLALYASHDGRTQLRTIEPEMIQAPRNPGEVERSIGWNLDKAPCCWSFGVQTDHDDIQTVYGYHLQWSSNTSDWEYLPAERVEHFKANVDRNIKRGLSDFYPVSESILDTAKALRNTIRGVSLQAAIAWIMQGAKGTTQAQMESLRGTAKVSEYNQSTQFGARTRTQAEYKPGTTLMVPHGQQYLPGPMGSDRVPNFVTAIQAVMRLIGSRWCMPEYMISGDASNANFSSTMVAESPFVKNCEAEQGYNASRFVSLMWKAVKIAHEAGQFARHGVSFDELEQQIEITVESPRVAVRDGDKETARRRILNEAGILSSKTWASQEELDFDQEVEFGAAVAGPAFGAPPVEAEADLPIPVAAPTEPIAAPATELQTTSDTVLNGAQVTAATAIVLAVAKGEIPRDAGIGQLQVLFNLQPPQAELIMGSAGTAAFTVKTPAAVTESSPPRSATGRPFGQGIREGFCPTGTGGGIDNSCGGEGGGGGKSGGEGGGGTSKQAHEMTRDEFIAAIGGRDDSLDETVGFIDKDSYRRDDTSIHVMNFKAKDGRGYEIRKSTDGQLHAFSIDELASSDDPDSVKSVGYFRAEKGQTIVAVKGDATGIGLGLELVYQFRKDNPLHPSGGLTSAGVGVNRAVHARLVSDAKARGLPVRESRTPSWRRRRGYP